MHDIVIAQAANLSTEIFVDDKRTPNVISYNITQDGPLNPIELYVKHHVADPQNIDGFQEVITAFPIGTLTVTTGGAGS